MPQGAFSLTFITNSVIIHTMKTYDYVEEYLEVLASFRELATGKPNPNWFFSFDPIINLARYDVSVLTSMTDQVTQNQALTERQGELLCKILLKYSRQLAAKGIDVGPIESPAWRVPLRKMDYSQRLSIKDDAIVVRFPYNQTLIDNIKDFSKTSQGVCRWDRDRKHWESALTEYNLSWLYTWAQANNFEIDAAVKDLMQIVLVAEQTPYAIELCVDGDQLNITNAESSLIDYINQSVGGFDLDNIARLIDMSAVLGYTVNADLAQAVISEFGPRFYKLASSREVKINPDTLMSSDDFESIIEYAEKSGRLPVVVYEPDLSGRLLEKLRTVRPEQDILVCLPSQATEINGSHKFVYIQRPVTAAERIPLIVSSAGMVFGGDKQRMIQRAEKVVYVAADVYNKKSVKVKSIAS